MSRLHTFRFCGLLLAVGFAALALSSCGPRDVRLEGERPLTDRELLAAARRPLATWRQPEHRQADLHDAAYAMESLLQDSGYPFAEVQFNVPPAASKKPVVFTVEAGDAIRLGSVTFPGRKSLSVENLTNFFFATDVFAREHAPFVLRDVESAIRLVERRYQLAGYLDMRASDPQITVTDDHADVVVPITEGPCYRVESVIWEMSDIPGDPLEGLRRERDLTGHAYHRLLGSELAAAVRHQLSTQGYLAAQVTVEEDMNRDTAAVVLTVRIVSGPQIRLGTFRITGNDHTRERFIRNRFPTMQRGSVLDGSAIDDGIRSLYRSGLFAQVTHTVDPKNGDVDVRVQEADTRGVEFSAGWGSYEQLRGSIGWVDDNVFGEGLRFSTHGRASMKGFGADAGLLDRHHLGDGRSLSLDLRYDQREEPSFLRIETVLSTTFRHELTIDFDPEARWSYRTIYALSFNTDDDIASEIPGEEVGTYRLSTITVGLQRDTRIIKVIDPEGGTLIDGSVSWSAEGLGSQIPYVDQRIRWTHFRRLAHDLVGVINVQAATRAPQDSDSLPIGERLFLGGDSTVRSFAKDELGPHGSDGKPLGGLSATSANLEFRWRPWREHRNIEVAAFYDFGALGAEAFSIDAPPGQAIGMGLRYVLPVGPIRFDAAWNPGETFEQESLYAVHLTVGFAF